MRNTSKECAIACRVSKEVNEVIKRRAGKQGITKAEYIAKRITYDILRKHRRVK